VQSLAGDRRGGRPRGGEGLLERDSALDAIEGALGVTAAGGSQALLLVGHSGMGKTRLHEATLDVARARKLLVVRAAGAELEQNLAFGVAAQMLRSLLSAGPSARRRALLAEAPKRILSLERGDPHDAEQEVGDHLALSHAFLTVLASATESSPALLAIDDLHWADPASLELVLYLLHRLDELPVTIVMTRRPAVVEDLASALAHIAAHPKIRVETLAPLGGEAVAEMIRRAFGESFDSALVEVCRETTAGNPFYLRELLLALGAEGELTSEQLSDRARSLAPDAVTRSLRVRVGRLGQQAAALARAVAILGDDVPVRHAAGLADMTIAQASSTADELAAVEVLLAREPLRFVHPLVRKAIERDIPASERATGHLEAARLLYSEGVGVERVAAHLLMGRSQGNPWAVERLRAAAREARARGGVQSAIRYLERALAEPPNREQRGEILAELGAVEAAIASPTATEHLTAALASTSDPSRRAALALELGRAFAAQGLHEPAAHAFDQGLGELMGAPGGGPDQELRDQLEAGFLAAATSVPSLHQRVEERASDMLGRVPDAVGTQGQRLLLAQAALEAASRGQPAQGVVQLAERAWDEGRILECAAPQWIGWRIVSSALCAAGELERAVEIAGAAVDDARRRGSPLAFATASFSRSIPRLWQGRVNDALADLEAARDGRRYGWRQFARGAAAFDCLCLIETGELGRAEAALTEDAPLEPPYDLEDATRLYALAELHRSRGGLEEALSTAISAGEVAEQMVPFLDHCPWRSCAVLAALALGDQEQARELADEALARAEQTGVPHQRIQALRLTGLSEGGAAGLQKLRAAVELAASLPPRLETIRALIDLGAALRRANQRAAARPPLEQAADLARQGGAHLLYQRARTELSASGARPRREALLSGPASLTPSERRIAGLAAEGSSNREIAAILFVTPKTVEYHLRNSYRKLEIQTRGELSEALGGEMASAS
jgi:DNA-binding CsgD family transcriptional regulator